MEAHLAPTQPTQVNKSTTSREICSGPHDTQYCMEDPEQAFVKYASLRTDKAGEEDDDVMFIEIISKDDNSRKEEPEAEGKEVEYFEIFLTRSELAYHNVALGDANVSGLCLLEALEGVERWINPLVIDAG
ncbi:hypothetical protein Tco_0929910 [Tanacetum coccineum]